MKIFYDSRYFVSRISFDENITEHLLMEAKENRTKICVLHASKMGDPIYTKLGFQKYGEIETYRILKEKNN